MKAEKLTIDDVRQAVYELSDNELTEEVKQMSDAEFLVCDFFEDLIFDSLDMMCFVLHLEKEKGLLVPPDFEKLIAQNGNTVQTCLDIYNAHLESIRQNSMCRN